MSSQETLITTELTFKLSGLKSASHSTIMCLIVTQFSFKVAGFRFSHAECGTNGSISSPANQNDVYLFCFQHTAVIKTDDGLQIMILVKLSGTSSCVQLDFLSAWRTRQQHANNTHTAGKLQVNWREVTQQTGFFSESSRRELVSGLGLKNSSSVSKSEIRDLPVITTTTQASREGMWE